MDKIEITGVDLFYGSFQALKSVNLNIPGQQITAFIGPSGCGKSTLLKSINRMNDLVEGCRLTGRIALEAVDVYHDMDVTELRKRVGMVFQKPNPFPMSVYDNIAYGPRTHGVRGRAKLDEIVEMKGEFDFRLLVDDAHGFGTMGPTGAGSGEHFGVMDQIDLYFATFAKSMAGIGAFIACDEDICMYLRYNMRSQTHSILNKKFLSNKMMNIAFLVGVILMIFAVNIDTWAGVDIFGTAKATWLDWVISISCAIAIIPMVELQKIIDAAIQKKKAAKAVNGISDVK